MTRRKFVPALMLGTLAMLGCASSGTGGRTATARDVITADEIRAANVRTAFEVVQRLRPQWLRARGTASTSGDPAEPIVYLDGVRYGELRQLNDVPAMDITQIRFINARDATTRFGTGHLGGVIEIITR